LIATDTIVSELDAEIARLQQVRSILAGQEVKQTKAGVKNAGRTRRPLSPQARKRIAAAQKKRWAAVRAKTA
jgi:hypothetical protein